MPGVVHALKISLDSFGYRLRKREANNLFVTASMLVAFGLPWPDAVLRGAFALLLNMYIYLINDVCDIELDSVSPRKDRQRVAYRSQHRGAAWGALGAEATLLAVAAGVHLRLFGSWLLPLSLAINTVVIFVYSRWLKRVPFADVAIMALAGASTTMVGVPMRPLGWKLLGLFAMLCAGYQVIQLARDLQEDRAKSLRTTAVLLGERGARVLFATIAVGAALYGTLIINSPVAAALAAGALLPLTVAKAERTWDLTRLLFGMVWLGLLAQIFLGQLS